MKQSQLFTKTLKESPKDETSVSAQLLERAGYIDKVAAGVYTLLPLGLKVVNNIMAIIRDEICKIDGQEILMPGLVPRENLEKTGRWEELDVLFKLKGRDEKEYGLGATHEEIVTPAVKRFILSYKDLPFATFQIQNKFRNELRAKSGVLRTREFLMKDLYSFHADEGDLDKYYERATEAYWNIFERCGIKDKTYFAFASGGTFSKYSHEFQTETEAGEDEIFICKNCRVGVNKEVLEGEFECPECHSKEFETKKCIEVGNIFKLKTKYSEPFDLSFIDPSGEKKPVQMGCYGLGIQRLFGAIAEVFHDDKGVIWPDNVAPFRVHLIALEGMGEKAEALYKKLQEMGAEVLYDDRDVSAGQKLAEADLLGIPNRVVISERTGDKFELKKRGGDDIKMVGEEELFTLLSGD